MSFSPIKCVLAIITLLCFISVSANDFFEKFDTSDALLAMLDKIESSPLFKTRKSEYDPFASTRQSSPKNNQNDFMSILADNGNTATLTNIHEDDFCSNVFTSTYVAEHILIQPDFENKTFSVKETTCTREIAHLENVRRIKLITQMIENDDLRVAVARLLCAFYYRSAPSERISFPNYKPKPICSSVCNRVVDLMPGYDSDLPESSKRDQAVIDTYLFDELLVQGYCEASSIYKVDIDDEPDSCVGHKDSDTFKPLTSTFIVRASCQKYDQSGICGNLVSYVYSSPELGNFDDAPPDSDNSVAYREAVYSDLRVSYALAPQSLNCHKHLSRFVCSRIFMPCSERSVPVLNKRGNFFIIKVPEPQMSDFDVCRNYHVNCKGLRDIMNRISHPLSSFFTLQGCTTASPYDAYYDCDNNMITPISNTQDSSMIFSMEVDSDTTSNMKLTAGDETIDIPKPDTHHMPTNSATGQPFDWPVYWFSANKGFYNTTAGLSQTNAYTYASQPLADKSLSFEPNVHCPYPLVIPTNKNTPNRLGEGSCAMPCPNIAFDRSDYEMVDKMVIVMSIIGTVLIVFLLATFLCFEEKRGSVNVIPFLSMSTLTSVAILIGVFVLFRTNTTMAEKLCATNSDPATMNQMPACAAQGFFILFGMLSLCAWWAVSAFDLFMKIVLGVRVPKGSFRENVINYCHYGFAWGIPLILCIIAAGTESLGPADLDMTYCFVQGRANPNIPWITAYYPIIIFLFIGSVSMGATLYVLCRATSKLQAATGNRNKDSWKHYFTAILFILVFFFLFLSIIIYRAVAYFEDSNWTKSATEYTNCLLINSNLYGDSCGTKPARVPNVGFWIFVQFIVAGSGFFCFLVYGLNADLYLLWAARIGYMFNIAWCIAAGKHTSEAHRLGTSRPSGNDSSAGSGTHSMRTKDSDVGSHSEKPSRVPGAGVKFRSNLFKGTTTGVGSSAFNTTGGSTVGSTSGSISGVPEITASEKAASKEKQRLKDKYSKYSPTVPTFKKGNYYDSLNIKDLDTDEQNHHMSQRPRSRSRHRGETEMTSMAPSFNIPSIYDAPVSPEPVPSPVSPTETPASETPASTEKEPVDDEEEKRKRRERREKREQEKRRRDKAREADGGETPQVPDERRERREAERRARREDETPEEREKRRKERRERDGEDRERRPRRERRRRDGDDDPETPMPETPMPETPMS